MRSPTTRTRAARKLRTIVPNSESGGGACGSDLAGCNRGLSVIRAGPSVLRSSPGSPIFRVAHLLGPWRVGKLAQRVGIVAAHCSPLARAGEIEARRKIAVPLPADCG